jgi:beta-aspartyl-peptidase (threonine type)
VGIAGRLPDDFRDAQGALIGDLLRRATKIATDPERVAGTVNFLAIDVQGNIASAVSTSGWAWKYPGRLGDSPIIGAGNYADSRYGAAACTGWGELALRASTARSVVFYLQQGLALEDACRAAFADLAAFEQDPQRILMSMVALDRDGNVCAVSTSAERTFLYRTAEMDRYRRTARLHLPLTP